MNLMAAEAVSASRADKHALRVRLLPAPGIDRGEVAVPESCKDRHNDRPGISLRSKLLR